MYRFIENKILPYFTRVYRWKEGKSRVISGNIIISYFLNERR